MQQKHDKLFMFRSLSKYKTGIYATIIFHLCLIIALMGLKISAVQQQIYTEINVDLDNEEQERQREELRAIQNELMQEIRGQIAEQQAERLRNAAVNEETPKDNRDKVFDENEQLQQRIAATYQMMKDQNHGEVALPPTLKKDQNAKPYTGPSVLSYFVKGRKAVYLPVPVYKCEAGGRVSVIVTVAETGDVVDAQVDKQKSEQDNCLWQSAMDAALRSKFNVLAGTRQQGTITYQFISQYR